MDSASLSHTRMHPREARKAGYSTATSWYAVHTKPKSEMSVAAALHRKGYEARVPMRKKTALVAHQESIVTVPLFPRYVLVSCVPTALTREAIFNVRGVDKVISRRSMTFSLLPDVLAEVERVDGSEVDDTAVSELMSWAFRPLGLY